MATVFEIITHPLFLSIYIGFILLLIMAFFSGPFFIFGVKLRIKKFLHPSNVGLLFIHNIGENFGLPKIVRLDKKQYKHKRGGEVGIYLFDREMFQQGKFFNMPYAMMPYEDIKTTVGLYYKEINEKGEETGNITAVKPSYSLRPEYFQSAVRAAALSQAIQDFLDKNRMLLYVLAGTGLVVGLSLFFTYEMYSTKIPEIVQLLNTISEQVSTQIK